MGFSITAHLMERFEMASEGVGRLGEVAMIHYGLDESWLEGVQDGEELLNLIARYICWHGFMIRKLYYRMEATGQTWVQVAEQCGVSGEMEERYATFFSFVDEMPELTPAEKTVARVLMSQGTKVAVINWLFDEPASVEKFPVRGLPSRMRGAEVRRRNGV